MRLERRNFDASMAASGESRRVAGHAAVFNAMSGDLGGFVEKIAPGAFQDALHRGDDARALWNHDPMYVLGRVKSGTLRMMEDEIGLAVEIDLPDTSTGRDTFELIRRGDVDQMSFAFFVTDEEWSKVEGRNVRTIKSVELVDVSPVTWPAYPQTDISVRSQLPESSLRQLEQLEGEEQGASETEADSAEAPGVDGLAADSLDLKKKLVQLAELT